MKYVSAVKLRIREILNEKKISIYQLSNLTGISSACIHNWYSKRDYVPNLDTLLKVCDALEISPTELFREDTDEMMCVTKEEKELLDKWILLNDKQRKAIVAQMEAYLEK